MAVEHYLGQRLSFDSILCIVRYIGPVQGTKGEWLGVEWDDPSRGKHSGQHDGIRYFDCKTKHSTAGSFVRPSRPADPPLSFLEALGKKYASETTILSSHGQASDKPLEWGGKVVEEVGFDKIRKQLAMLNELRIVLLDGLCIASPTPTSSKDEQSKKRGLEKIKETCPRIRELDLSRNLVDQWADVVGVCGQLGELRSLKVNGNRFQSDILKRDKARVPREETAFASVNQLELEDCLMTWEEITSLAASFKSLTLLSASSNNLTQLTPHTPPQSITTLTLESNRFDSLQCLAPLAALPKLQNLHLRNNSIGTVGSDVVDLRFSHTLTYVDLSHNAIDSWSFIDGLADIFPGLTGLRVAHNPLYDGGPAMAGMGVEEGFMLTLARLGQLQNLNFSVISAGERSNAEMYYLFRIGQALVEVAEAEEEVVLAQHRRYKELCELYGAPTVSRTSTANLKTNTLESRLINFTFKLDPSFHQDGAASKPITKSMQIPRTFDTYRVKGIVGKLFGIRPLGTRLIWETGDWDPVAGYQDDEYDSDDAEGRAVDRTRNAGKWTRRTVELEDGTREIGFWIDGREANVKIERRERGQN